MAKGLNKHTPDSEELLKRLNSNDSNGLDDFEKEALEGFDSLDNPELAKNLTDSLNKKIDENYFQKEGGNKKGLMYLSMAAGLVLIVGLSIYFTNIMGDKKEMAMDQATPSEKIANEVSQPTDLAPAPPPAELEQAPKAEGKSSGAGGDIPVTTADAITKSEEKFVNTKDARANTGEQKPDKDDGLTSRMVVKEKKLETAKEPYKSADAESGDDLKNTVSDKTKGPPAGNNSPASPAIVVEDQKAKPAQKAQDEEVEKITLSKTNSDNNNNITRNDSKGGKDAAKKSESPKKEKRKESNGEALGKEDAAVNLDETSVAQTSNSQTTLGGVASGNKNNEDGYLHTTEYDSRVYSKPQDYIKTEISKSEMLKTNVKAFKAELTIDENGKVKDVKFLTAFDNCTSCKKELEKILLNMPGWKSTSSKKAVKETVSYIDQ
jgi:hypothetical protein